MIFTCMLLNGDSCQQKCCVQFFPIVWLSQKKHWCFVSCMFFEPFGWVALSTDTTTVCENSPSRVAGSLSSHSSWQAGAGGLWKIPTARFGILFPPTSRLTRGKWVEDYGCSQDPAKKNMKTRARDKNREASSFLRKKKADQNQTQRTKKKNNEPESWILSSFLWWELQYSYHCWVPKKTPHFFI